MVFCYAYITEEPLENRDELALGFIAPVDPVSWAFTFRLHLLLTLIISCVLSNLTLVSDNTSPSRLPAFISNWLLIMKLLPMTKQSGLPRSTLFRIYAHGTYPAFFYTVSSSGLHASLSISASVSISFANARSCSRSTA